MRLVAAGLAARLKFTLEDIEDLKIAVDELSAYLTGAHGRAGTLAVTLRLSMTTGFRSAEPASSPSATKVRTELTEFSRMILETVADSAELSASDGNPTFPSSRARRPDER